MLFIRILIIITAISLLSTTITKTSFLSSYLGRISAIILLYSTILSYNILYINNIGSGIGLYSGLFYVNNIIILNEIIMYIIGTLLLISLIGRSIGEKYYKGKLEYSLLLLFIIIGASFLLSSIDLISMFLSIELQSFSLYILAALWKNNEKSVSRALKYFLLGALSSSLILLGCGIIYSYTGLTNIDYIYTLLRDSTSVHSLRCNNINNTGIFLGLQMIVIGLLFKVAAAPLHSWAPDVYDGVPTIVTTVLTILPKVSILIFLFRLLNLNTIDQGTRFVNIDSINYLLYTRSFISLLIGTILGLAQYRIKRLLAYRTIRHIGFLLLGLSIMTENSIRSFIFYLIQYSLTNLNIFLIIIAFGYLVYRNNSVKSLVISSSYKVINYKNIKCTVDNAQCKTKIDLNLIKDYDGLFKLYPLLSLRFAISLFSMAGIPPLIGFFAKYNILHSSISNGYYFISLIAIITRVISAAYYLRLIRVLHFNPVLLKQSTVQSTSNYLPSENKIENNLIKKNNDIRFRAIHSYIIATLTIIIRLYLVIGSLLLNSTNIVALSYFIN